MGTVATVSLRRAAAVLIVIATTLGPGATRPAGADVVAQGTRITVQAGGHRRAPRPRTPIYRDCRTTDLSAHLTAPLLRAVGFRADPPPTDAAVAWRSCVRISTGEVEGWIVGLDSGTGPTSSDLAGAAVAEVDPPLPTVSTSPPRRGVVLDGVPVWFWMADPGPVSATASIPGLSATLVATPARSRIRVSDGTEVSCPDLGTPYDPGRPTSAQHTDCSHTFDEWGTFRIEATVVWTLAWTASDGQTGTLPSIERTTSFDLPVEEAQAVTGP